MCIGMMLPKRMALLTDDDFLLKLIFLTELTFQPSVDSELTFLIQVDFD